MGVAESISKRGAVYKYFTEGSLWRFLGTDFDLVSLASKNIPFGFRGHFPKKVPKIVFLTVRGDVFSCPLYASGCLQSLVTKRTFQTLKLEKKLFSKPTWLLYISTSVWVLHTPNAG